MELISTVEKTFEMVNGEVTSKITAKLVNPKVLENGNKITFTTQYYVTEKVIVSPKKEAIIETDVDGNKFEIAAAIEEVSRLQNTVLYSYPKIYNKQQIEGLYSKVKSILDVGETYEDRLMTPVYIAFENEIKNGDYFKLTASQWERK